MKQDRKTGAKASKPLGRPKLPESQRRIVNAIAIRWLPAEVTAIEAAAKRADVPASALVRAGALELASQPVKAIRAAVEQHGQK